MPDHTIRGTFGLDTKPAKESLDDLKRYAERHAGEIKKAVAGAAGGGGAAPSGPNAPRGGGPGGGGSMPPEDLRGAIASGTIAGNGFVKVVQAIADRFVEVNEEAVRLEQNIAKITHGGATSGRFETLDKMKETIEAASKQSDELRNKLLKFGGENIGGKVLGSIAATSEAAFRGMTPGALRKEIAGQQQELNKTGGDQLDKMAQKSREIAGIDEARFHVSQREAELRAESLKHDETQGKLAALTAQTGKQNLALTDEENRRHEEAVKQIGITNDGLDREAETRQKNANISEREAITQRGIAETQTRGLTVQQTELVVSKAQVELARLRKQSAESELSAAKAQVEEAEKKGSVEAKREAQERVTRAQAGVASAEGGVASAAGKAAQTEASALEANAAEYNMTPAQKGAQYSQRREQYLNQRRYAEATGTPMPTAPVMGATEYDPMRGFKAARAAQIQEQSKAESQQQEAGEQSKKRQAVENIQAGKAATSLGVDINSPYTDKAKLAEIQRNKEAFDATPVQGHSETPGGTINGKQVEAVKEKKFPWEIPASDYAEPGGETKKGGLMYPSSGEYPDMRDWTAGAGHLPAPMPKPDAGTLGSSSQPGMDQAIAGMAEKVATSVAAVMREFWGR